MKKFHKHETCIIHRKQKSDKKDSKNRSTEDQIVHIVQENEDSFQEKKSSIATWIGTENAFDKV